MGDILEQSWKIYRERFLVIVAVVLVVWTPLELFSSYMDAFVFGEDDFVKSLKLARFLENFFGIIATAGVIFIGYETGAGRPATFGRALEQGLTSWGRMWWTRFLSSLAIVLGLLLLIVPGIYLLVRLALVEPIAVQERISGPAAMQRSFALTEGRFWTVFQLGLAVLATYILAMIVLVAPTVFVPGLDHWIIDAATQLACDVVLAFGTITLVTAFAISQVNKRRRF
jgi:hypothetical protein